MRIIELLTKVNSSYLVALAVLVGLVVEALKAVEIVSGKYLPLVAGSVGWLLGLGIGVMYHESLGLASLNGVIIGLLASGGFDVMKAVWQLPEQFK